MPHLRHKEAALLLSTFVIAVCGLVYELLESTLSSYLLGDSVYYFSLVIGLFMSSMGIGAWLSRFIHTQLLRRFILLQLLIALLGGFSATILYFAFAVIENYAPFLYLVTLLLGTMLGIEIPLIIRILQDRFTLKVNVSNVFTLDYIGALAAALLFPLLFLPKLGLLQTAFFFGLMNAAVALLAWFTFRDALPFRDRTLAQIVIVTLLLVLGMAKSPWLVGQFETRLFADRIIFSQTTPYQKLTVTRRNDRVRLYINGALQFDSMDEYRYHEALIHPPMSALPHRERILVIGGGDGLAVRELLRYDAVTHIDLVDLDPQMTQLFRTNALMLTLNKNALNDLRVTVTNADAWKHLESRDTLYNLIVIDLPDPNTPSLSRLYSTSFYRLAASRLAKGGALVTQATSALFSRDAFWCIDATVGERLTTLPYHAYVPSFGEWGFVMGSQMHLAFDPDRLPPGLRFVDAQTLQRMQHFAPDIGPVDVQANRLDTHALLHYYHDGWKKWYE